MKNIFSVADGDLIERQYDLPHSRYWIQLTSLGWGIYEMRYLGSSVVYPFRDRRLSSIFRTKLPGDAVPDASDMMTAAWAVIREISGAAA